MYNILVLQLRKKPKRIYKFIQRFGSSGKTRKIVSTLVKNTPHQSTTVPINQDNVRTSPLSTVSSKNNIGDESSPKISNSPSIPTLREVSSTKDKVPPGTQPGFRGFFSNITRFKDSTYQNMPKATYSTYIVNKPDYYTKDNLELSNNPSVISKTGKFLRHYEVQRHTCEIPGCNSLFCKGACKAIVESKSVGHLSGGGNPSNEPQKHTIVSNGQKLNGAPGPQNLVMYYTAHTVPNAQEKVAMTKQLNSDTKLITEIRNHEDKD